MQPGCDELWNDRKREGKAKIINWERVLGKIKIKFLAKDYQLNIFKQLQKLRQRLMKVRVY